MNPIAALERWLDIRPAERRAFLVSAAGAFVVIGFSVTARSLREAFFLDEFDVAQLPYVTIATTVLSLPAVAAFTKLLARRGPDRVYRELLLLVAAGLLLLWGVTTFVQTDPVVRVTTVSFYVFTAVGTLLLTSGFWTITSERFQLRDAKRLFGLISAGGTLGAMVAGLSVGPITATAGNSVAVLSLVAALLAVLALQRLQPVPDQPAVSEDASRASLRDALAVVRSSEHLRVVATVVAVATLASYLVDFQFKEAAEAAFDTDEALAGFFGLFYGITGMIALLLQVLIASRLLTGAGVGWSLSVLPLALLTGSTFLALTPGLMAATILRGSDASLRKSLHRAVLEFLWVPVDPRRRRQTKTFIDSFVDSAFEGIAAAFVFLWVTLGGLPTRGLTLLVVLLSILLLALARRMGPIYLRTVLNRLSEGGESIDEEIVQTQFVGGEFTMTVTRFDASNVLSQTDLSQVAGPVDDPADEDVGDSADGPVERLSSSRADVVSRALDETDEWSLEELPALVRLLARDPFYRRAGDALSGIDGAVDRLRESLLDESADFVIRRRIPRVLGRIPDAAAHRVLLEGLSTRRFEVRYRCAAALARRRKAGLPETPGADAPVWAAIRAELNRERPIWELQKLLDDEPSEDDFVTGKVRGRGELSLQHTFRLLSLVLEPDPVRTAFHGVVLDDEHLRSLSLEYLEQVLPLDVRDKLWPFIGDLSEQRQRREIRGRHEVVADLLKTGVTLFGDENARARLRAALQDQGDDDG